MLDQMKGLAEQGFSAEITEAYGNMGGTPWLDFRHTVFGQVTDGMEVVDAIAAVAVGAGDKPIEDVLIKIHMFNVTTIKPEVSEFTALITQCCNGLKIALQEFSNFKKSTTLREKIIEVNHLEEAGDRLYYSTVHNLYVNSKDPVELLVWTEIFDYLEKCCDSCEEAADVIESIVMKNS
jgi:hypothetical protein